jgi:hypothetical protein
MGNDSYNAPFSADDGPLWQTSELLQGLISPAPAQSLVAPPPDTPPPTQPGRTTPLTGNLTAAPTQATPKTAPAPAEESAVVATSYRDQLKTGGRGKIRHGLAAYFSSGIGDKENQPKTDQGKAAFLFRRPVQLEPSRPSPVNRLLSEAPREAPEKQMPQASANTDNQTYRVVQAQANSPTTDRSKDPRYIKIQSRGQIGYLPKNNLQRAKQRDRTLKVLG